VFLLTDAGSVFFNSQKFLRITFKISWGAFHNETECFRKCEAQKIPGHWGSGPGAASSTGCSLERRPDPSRPRPHQGRASRLRAVSLCTLLAFHRLISELASGGVMAALARASCPLLGKPRFRPAGEKILPLCSGRRGAGSRQRVTASSRAGPATAPFACRLGPLPHGAHFFRPGFGSSPSHAASMPNKSRWG